MSPPFEPGKILAGKFRIERVLGSGGMGVVVAARHLQLDELVAIKFLSEEAVNNQQAVLRFEREARAAVKIKSEHVARVSDVGELEWGAPYMVMEYLNGQDLSEILREHGPLPVDEAIDYLLQACEAIAEAHSLGIVHRDLKPSNLFLVRRPDGSPCVKVLDFGISKLTGLSGSNPNEGFDMTRTAAVMGSPLYMSPEQLSSARDVDMTTDVWGLGVSLFELLTGHLPFQGETLPQLCLAIVSHPPAALRASRPELPLGLEAVIAACLEKDRSLRVQTVAELAQRLSEFAPKRSLISIERISGVSQAAGFSSSSPVPSVTAPQKRDGGGTVSDFGRTTRSRAPKTWWAIGAVALLCAAVAAYFGAQDSPGEPIPSAAAPPGTHSVPADLNEPAVVPLDEPLPQRPSASLSTPPSAPLKVAAARKAREERRPSASASALPRKATSTEAAPGKNPSGEWGGRL